MASSTARPTTFTYLSAVKIMKFLAPGQNLMSAACLLSLPLIQQVEFCHLPLGREEEMG